MLRRKKVTKSVLAAILAVCILDVAFNESNLSSSILEASGGRTLGALRDKKPVAHIWKDDRRPVSVPKLLHFMILGDNPPESLIEMVNFSAKLEEKNGFIVKAWRDEDAEKLVEAHDYKFPGLKETWEYIKADQTLQKGAKRADFIRILAMWSMGGVHLDADFIPCKGLDFMIDTPGVVSFPVMPDRTNEVNGCLMSSPPHHRLFELALETIIEFGPKITHMHNLEAAGPHVMAKITDTYFKEIGIEVDPIFEGESTAMDTVKPIEGVVNVDKEGYWRVTIGDIRFKGDTRDKFMYHLGARTWAAGRELQAPCIEHPELIAPFLEEYCSRDLKYQDDPHFARDCGKEIQAKEPTDTKEIVQEQTITEE